MLNQSRSDIIRATFIYFCVSKKLDGSRFPSSRQAHLEAACRDSRQTASTCSHSRGTLDKNQATQGFPRVAGDREPVAVHRLGTKSKNKPVLDIRMSAALSTKTKQPEVSLGLLVIENQSQFTD